MDRCIVTRFGGAGAAGFGGVWRRFRFHVLGLHHLPVATKYNACAYTQKIWKMCEMMLERGHEVFLYAAESSDAPCTRFIETHTLRDLRLTFGDKDYRGDEELGYDWRGQTFRHAFDKHDTSLASRVFHARTIAEINLCKRPDDFLLLPMGLCDKVVADGVGLYLTCEPGIGYTGSYCAFRAFESSYIQSFTYGSANPYASIDGLFYHRVIPNYFRLADFDFVPKEKRDYNYYLFLGRICHRKGYSIAVDTCKHIGAKLIIAGQGCKSFDEKTRKMIDSDGYECILPPNVEYVGYADAKKRNRLMSHAIACFTPTLFLEPFCGVAVEAQMCGTPVLTTNYGAFVETVIDGKTGFRCNTMDQFAVAARKVVQLDNEFIRERAVRLYSCETVGNTFEQWFDDLYDVYESTIDQGIPGWNRFRDDKCWGRFVVPSDSQKEHLDKAWYYERKSQKTIDYLFTVYDEASAQRFEEWQLKCESEKEEKGEKEARSIVVCCTPAFFLRFEPNSVASLLYIYPVDVNSNEQTKPNSIYSELFFKQWALMQTKSAMVVIDGVRYDVANRKVFYARVGCTRQIQESQKQDDKVQLSEEKENVKQENRFLECKLFLFNEPVSPKPEFVEYIEGIPWRLT